MKGDEIKIGDLRALIALDETGSIHSASYALGMSYNTAKVRIKKLERLVGKPLNEPKDKACSKGSRLTPAGKDMLETAQYIIKLWDEE